MGTNEIKIPNQTDQNQNLEDSKQIIEITKLSNTFFDESVASSLDSTYGLLPIVMNKRRIRLAGRKYFCFRGEISFFARDEGFFEDVCETVPEKKFISEKCDMAKKIFLVRNIRSKKNV